MIRFLVYLAIAVGLVWFATSVPLGKHTLVGHFRAIWHRDVSGAVEDGGVIFRSAAADPGCGETTGMAAS